MKEKTDRLKQSRKKGGAEPQKPGRLRKEEVILRVNEIAGQMCDDSGLELVHTEYQREPQGVILRVYIDKKGGVTLRDCADLSRQLSDLLDIHVDIAENYNLEVSSPGLNRPLGKLSDFLRFKGHQARIRIKQPIDGQKNFTGTLDGVAGDNVLMQVGDRIVEICYQDITKARLVNYNGDI